MNKITILGTLNMNDVKENPFDGGTFYQFSIAVNQKEGQEPVWYNVSTTSQAQIDYLKSLGNVPVLLITRPQTGSRTTSLMFDDIVVLDGQIGSGAKMKLIGSITENSDLTIKGEGDKRVVNFTVAAKTGYDSKNKKTIYAYIRVSAWREMADRIVEKYATHKTVALDCFTRINSFEFEGKTYRSVEAVVEREAFFLNSYEAKEAKPVEEKPAAKPKKTSKKEAK